MMGGGDQYSLLIGGSIKESSGGKVWMTLKEGEGVD
jgi:hypothetical protein